MPTLVPVSDPVALDVEWLADGHDNLVRNLAAATAASWRAIGSPMASRILRDRGRVRGLLDIAQDDGKLIAAESGDRVDLANARPEPLGHGLKQEIADRMAERVVHVLEMIEIEIQDREALHRRRARAIDCSSASTKTPRLASPVRLSKRAI